MEGEFLSELFQDEDALLEQQLLTDNSEQEQWAKEQAEELNAACERQHELQKQLRDVSVKTLEQGEELNKLVHEVQVWFEETELQRQQEEQEQAANNPNVRITSRATSRALQRNIDNQKEEEEEHEEEEDEEEEEQGVEDEQEAGAGGAPMSREKKAVNPNTTRLGRFVTSPEFNGVSTTVILLNAVFIGYSIQYAIDHVGEPQNKTILHLEWAFYAFYLVELVLKLLVFGRYFFSDSEWKWNLFDLILVILSFYDVIMYIIVEQVLIGNEGANVAWLRLLRLLKMLKMLRVVRVVRFFRELRLMFNSIASSFRSLFWAMVMLLLMMYIFALSFIQGATMYVLETQPKDISFEVEESIFLHWTTVFDALNTLFMVISGGTDWINPLMACRAMGWFYEFLFLFYLLFATVAVLNVLTGIFVDAAIDAANSDNETVLRESMQGHHARADWVSSAFFQENDDGTINDSITKQDFERKLQDDEIVKRLHMLEIDTSEAQWLFTQLDTSADGEVSREELGEGLLKLKGMARSIDMIELSHEFEMFARQIDIFMPYVEDCFSAIGRAIEKRRKRKPIQMPALGEVSTAKRSK